MLSHFTFPRNILPVEQLECFLSHCVRCIIYPQWGQMKPTHILLCGLKAVGEKTLASVRMMVIVYALAAVAKRYQ
jgi:hypothetical protein